MTQKKLVKNKVGVAYTLKISNGWELTKIDHCFMLSHTLVFIHGNKIRFTSSNKENAWLSMYENNNYLASLWINNAIDIKNIKEFIKVD